MGLTLLQANGYDRFECSKGETGMIIFSVVKMKLNSRLKFRVKLVNI